MEANEKENEQEENVEKKKEGENVVDELEESEGGESERNINISISFRV